MNPAPYRLLTLANLFGCLLNAEQERVVLLQHISPFSCLQLSSQLSIPHRVKWVDNSKDDPATMGRTGIAETDAKAVLFLHGSRSWVLKADY